MKNDVQSEQMVLWTRSEQTMASRFSVFLSYCQDNAVSQCHFQVLRTQLPCFKRVPSGFVATYPMSIISDAMYMLYTA